MSLEIIFVIFTTFMERSFHFIGILLPRNLYILAKGPWAWAQLAHALIRPWWQNGLSINILFLHKDKEKDTEMGKEKFSDFITTLKNSLQSLRILTPWTILFDLS